MRQDDHRLLRWLLSLVVVFHVIAMAASLFPASRPGLAIRRWTRPYEQATGFYQNWTMFTAPGRHSSHLAASGLLADGSEVELPPPYPRSEGEVFPDHWRVAKLERQLLGESRRGPRRLVARRLCREASAAGQPIRAVRFFKVRHSAPRWGEGKGRIRRTIKREALETVSCPR